MVSPTLVALTVGQPQVLMKIAKSFGDAGPHNFPQGRPYSAEHHPAINASAAEGPHIFPAVHESHAPRLEGGQGNPGGVQSVPQFGLPLRFLAKGSICSPHRVQTNFSSAIIISGEKDTTFSSAPAQSLCISSTSPVSIFFSATTSKRPLSVITSPACMEFDTSPTAMRPRKLQNRGVRVRPSLHSGRYRHASFTQSRYSFDPARIGSAMTSATS